MARQIKRSVGKAKKKTASKLTAAEKEQAEHLEKSFFKVAQKGGEEHQTEILSNMKKLLESVMDQQNPLKVIEHMVSKISNEMKQKGLSPCKPKLRDEFDD